MPRPAAPVALLLGALFAFVLVPPVMGFYFGWHEVVRAPGGGTWSPWATSLARAFMSWLVYGYMAVEGELFTTSEGRSVLAAFLATTLAAAGVIRLGGRDRT